jgi:hypothetical protein
MNNHRKESRKKLMAFTPVYDLLHKTLLGYVGDLTLQGVMVIGEKTVETNKHFTLGIEFPSSLPEIHAMRRMTARSILISALNLLMFRPGTPGKLKRFWKDTSFVPLWTSRI